MSDGFEMRLACLELAQERSRRQLATGQPLTCGDPDEILRTAARYYAFVAPPWDGATVREEPRDVKA